MEVKELQQQAEEIISKIDQVCVCKHDNETTLIHLFEEIGEISRQIVNPKLNRERINQENLAEEIADVTLLISKLANNNNINLEIAIKEKLEKLNRRHNL